ncbi:protein of unknown function DUF979 [Thermosinus carboxydivorans Nor1]|uniref:Permease n=1 Tax=Thermosinus carboxydivorans Nor1 TaxID=401526 RepID=A1HQX9_9FIRM|nr:DUF979 domain-containing protein [Thermosinus carboxydivorans]EAX47488.1 protein of unknown function DUF979 [Thermosinus carboxydivorans Nor1]
MNITLDHVYYLTGAFLLVFTAYTLVDNAHKAKWGTALFWGLYGITFIWGTQLPPGVVGGVVVLMAVIAGAKWMGLGSYNEASRETRLAMAHKFKEWLFVPALAVPIITFLIAKYTKLGALVGFGIGSVVGLALALALTREKVGQTFNEGRRLLDAIGWAVILSQFLAALGFLFDKAGVGKVVADLVSSVVPADSLLATVVAYCVGMALFTMIMGNAFAAFAVITTGIGIPLVIKVHGADPAIAGVIAMVSGYCGTLMTPMAANFNIVPAALLEIKDKNGVIKAQVLTAIPLLIINICLMYFLAFRR